MMLKIKAEHVFNLYWTSITASIFDILNSLYIILLTKKKESWQFLHKYLQTKLLEGKISFFEK